jgi:ABC-type dipeptide/oligopeptide/nickel transport system ATPase component
VSTKEALQVAENLLDELKITDPIRVLRSYPHQLSGGMRAATSGGAPAR